MDIFGLGNILNALKINKGVDAASHVAKGTGSEKKNAARESFAGDSVSISSEAVVKSSIEKVSQELESRENEVREEKVAEIRGRVSQGQYSVQSQKIAEQITKGPDVYESLK